MNSTSEVFQRGGYLQYFFAPRRHKSINMFHCLLSIAKEELPYLSSPVIEHPRGWLLGNVSLVQETDECYFWYGLRALLMSGGSMTRLRGEALPEDMRDS